MVGTSAGGSGVRVTRCADAPAFRGRAGEFLVAREAEHNLILGLTWTLEHDPSAYGDAIYLAVAEDAAGAVLAAAVRTPPHNLVLSEVEQARTAEVIGALAGDVASDGTQLPGVLGGRDSARAFATAWEERTGARAELGLRERIYRLSSVRAPAPVSGEMRAATERDRPLLLEWLIAFWREAHGSAEPVDAVAAVERWLRGSRTMYLWEDGGRPVSMAGAGASTPNGTRIGPVYTPPEFRRRGYASALVALVSQAQLDAGRRFCFLYTDLANPTSNRIYQAIGYEPVMDVDEYRFSSRPA